MLSAEELELLEDRCRAVPLMRNTYAATDFVTALFDTVLDYQNQVETLRKAGDHFERYRWNDVRTLDDLEAVFGRYANDRDGNDALAGYLWGNHHWRRAQELRGLAAYFRERDVTGLESLRAWSLASTPDDFVGHIKGLGPTIYRGLVMRLGVDTIKPDVWIMRFVNETIGRSASTGEAVLALEEVARRLGIEARTLDWSVWEFQARANSAR